MKIQKLAILLLIINSICFADQNNDQNAISRLQSDPVFIAFNKMRIDLNKMNKILRDRDPNIILEEYPDTIIETEPNIARGFPAIFKIKVKGISNVSAFTLFQEKFDIALVFRSKDENKLYIINSKGPTIELSFRDGGGYAFEKGLVEINVSKENSRAMLLDVSSLSPVYERSLDFRYMRLGEYSVYAILFDYSRTLCKVSNTIPISIIAPTEAEEKYINKVRRDNTWSSILRENLPISKDDLVNLNPTAKRNMEFHLLLSEILTSKQSLKDIPIDQLQAMTVPHYLVPEKESLIFELKLVSGRINEDDEELKNFINKHPELKWRFDNIKTNGGDFLYQKVKAEKGNL